jgi:hypothetical protein
MEASSPLDRAVDQLGLTALARLCGVSHQAVRKWQKAGRMPRTEWTGETAYSTAIEQALAGAITRAELLGTWPKATGCSASTASLNQAAQLATTEASHG